MLLCVDVVAYAADGFWCGAEVGCYGFHGCSAYDFRVLAEELEVALPRCGLEEYVLVVEELDDGLVVDLGE